ncbi:hypothetical protein BDV12DRAFT_160426 [Aspergillus spectabilis]
MLFAKSIFFVALFALGKVVAAAGTGTPACLLTVVGPETPGDLKALCKTNGDEIQSSIRDECGDDAKDALKYYASVCDDAGFEVDISSPTSTSTSSSHSSTSTDSDSDSSTSTSGATTTGGASSTSEPDSENATTTDDAEDPVETNGASTDKQVSAAAFAAVVFLGFAATL